jgi:hypothetical protein
MEKTRLQFQNINDLVSFQKLIDPGCYRIDTANLILACDCEEDQIRKALDQFGAEVVLLPFSVL